MSHTNQSVQCRNCDNDLRYYVEEHKPYYDSPVTTREFLYCPSCDSEQDFVLCPARDGSDRACHAVIRATLVRRIVPPKAKTEIGFPEAVLGCGFWVLVLAGLWFLFWPGHHLPSKPTPAPVVILTPEQQKEAALAQGHFLAADDLPFLANKAIPPNTFVVGTWTSDGGQSGGHPSVTAPLSGPPRVIHAWITFSHGIDVRTVRRGQTWTYTKEAPLRITQVTREGDGRFDVRATDSVLPP